MRKKVAALAGIWTVVAVCAVAGSGAAARQPEGSPSTVTQAPPPAPVQPAGSGASDASDRETPAVVAEMQALSRHARVGMLCYKAPAARASVDRAELVKLTKEIVALTNQGARGAK